MGIADGDTARRLDELAQKVFALNPESARGHWFRGAAAFHQGDIGRAIRAFEHSEVLAPDAVDNLLYLGYAYVDVGRTDGAKARFARALELDPLTPLTQAMPGAVAVFEGRAAEGEPYGGRSPAGFPNR